MIRPHGQQGLTILECVIGLLIFSIGMLGLSSLNSIIVRGNSSSQKLTTATLLAQDKLESLHQAAYLSVVNESEEITTVERQVYHRRVNVADDTPAAGMKTVVVSVRWAKSDTPDYQVELQTILTERRE